MQSWTATINSVTPDPGGLFFVLVATFTNGTASNQVSYNVSDPNSVNNIIQNQLNQYNAVANLAVSTGTWKEPVAVIPTPPTLLQQAQTTWQANYQTYLQMNNAITAGFMTSADKPYTDLVATLKSTWLPTYLSLLASRNGL